MQEKHNKKEKKMKMQMCKPIAKWHIIITIIIKAIKLDSLVQMQHCECMQSNIPLRQLGTR